MNKINLSLVCVFLLFINEYSEIHKISLFLMLILGACYYYNNRSIKLDCDERHLIILFLLYFLSYIPSFIVDVNFQWRHLDHPSRFLLYLPLLFFLKQIRDFKSLKYIYFVSTTTGSLVVICNYFFWNVNRGFYFNSCISGAQHLQILGLFSLVFAINYKCKKIQYMGWIAYLLSNIAVLCSETRGVILCIPLLFIIILHLSRRKVNCLKIYAISLIAFSILIYSLLQHPRIQKRFESTIENVKTAFNLEQKEFDQSSSIGLRLLLLKYGMKAFLKHPALGSGRSGFQETMVDEGYPDSEREWASHCHNQYLSALAMRGILGFSILMFFIISLLRIFLRFHKLGYKDYSFSICGIIFVFSYFLYFITDSPLIGSMHSSRFFIFMALLLFYSCKSECASGDEITES